MPYCSRKLSFGLGALLLPLVVNAQTLPGQERLYNEGDFETKAWEEVAATLPAAPLEANLVRVELGGRMTQQLYVDTASINVGGDGVLRFTSVLVSESGARNVAFEGLRCVTMERRLYAFGRRDGSWGEARGKEWSRLKKYGVAPYAYGLYRDYFCPRGDIVRSREEAVDALRRGGHPAAAGVDP